MCAMNVGNLLPLALAFVIIRELTLEKDPMSAVNVGRHLVATPTSFSTRRLTVE